MKNRPDILWPAAVIGLLLLSGITTFAVLFASKSDGGAQVIDNYYRRSVAWDSLAAEQRASNELGWHLRVDLTASSDDTAILVVTDQEGGVVDGLSGSVSVSRPQASTTFGTHSLTPIDSTSGAYRFSFPYHERGLWDLQITAVRGDQRLLERVRVEI